MSNRNIGYKEKDGTLVKEHYDIGGSFGEIYKDYDAFENKTNEVCYVSELSDTTYTYADYLSMAEEVFDELGAKGNPDKLANQLFEFSSWQSPSTLIDEWHNEGEFIDYPLDHGIETIKCEKK
jgi:hypothetical protein